MPDIPLQALLALTAIWFLRSSSSHEIIFDSTTALIDTDDMMPSRLETAPLRSMQLMVPGIGRNCACFSTPPVQ